MCRHFLLAIVLGALAWVPGCATIPPYAFESEVTSIDFSPDGKLLALANNREIRVYDFAGGQLLTALTALPPYPAGTDDRMFRHGLGDTAVFLDDARLASTGMGGLVTIWDARGGQRVAGVESLQTGEFASSIDYSPSARRLAIGTNTGRILLAPLEGSLIGTAETVAEQLGYVWDLQFSRDGAYLASASLLPAESLDEPPVDRGAGFGEEGFDQIPSRPNPSNVFIWDLEHPGEGGVLDGARGVLRMERVTGEQALLVAGNEIEIWEFLTRSQVAEVSDPSMVLQSVGIGALAVVSVAGLAVSGLPGGSFAQSLATTLPAIPTPTSVRYGCAREAATSPDGRLIVSTTPGPSHNVMAVIDRAENRVIEKWGTAGSVCDLQFSPDGAYLLYPTSRGVIRVDTRNWKRAAF